MKLLNCDIFGEECIEAMSKIDAIITDPPYDLDIVSNIDAAITMKRLISACSGNALFFCKPENQYHFTDWDEYLFWVKTPSTKNFTKKCGRFVEMILVRRKGETFNKLHWSQMTGVYDDRLETAKLLHPYQKPYSLVERLVRIYTNPGDIVLDPFMGSGTVGLACKNNGRNFVGIEKDEAVFLSTKKRLLGE